MNCSTTVSAAGTMPVRILEKALAVVSVSFFLRLVELLEASGYFNIRFTKPCSERDVLATERSEFDDRPFTVEAIFGHRFLPSSPIRATKQLLRFLNDIR